MVQDPVELIDLMMIMYRYIFIMYEQAREIWQAQIMRLGYSRVRESIRSFSMLCGMLFISSWTAGEGLIQAMDCRCYDGIMPSLDPGWNLCRYDHFSLSFSTLPG